MHKGGTGARMMIRPIQVRMARAALKWTVRELEKKAGVNKNTISRYEAGRDVLSATLESIQRAFIKEGVIFIQEEGDLSPGVRLKQMARARMTKVPRRSGPQKRQKSKTKPK